MDPTMMVSGPENLGGVDRPFYIDEQLMPSPTMSAAPLAKSTLQGFTPVVLQPNLLIQAP